MQGFKTLVPIPVTAAVFVSSTVPENEHPEWVSGTTYAQFARVIHNHVIYEDGLGGVSTTAPSADSSRWVTVNPTNQWRIFDSTQLAQTAAPNEAQYRFKPSKAIQGFIAIEQENVESMQVRLIDPDDGVVYDQTTSSSLLPVDNSFYSWFFGPLVRRSPIALQTNFPSYPNAELVVDFRGGADMKFGPILFGEVRTWGIGVRTGGSLKPVDYSLNEADAFGRIKYVPRGYAAGGEFQIVVANNQLDNMYNYFMNMRRNPAALIPSDSLQSTIFYGRFNFSVVIPRGFYSEVSLTLQGLVKNG